MKIYGIDFLQAKVALIHPRSLRLLFAVICLMSLRLQVSAAVPKPEVYKGIVRSSGVLRGGTAGVAFTLKDIRRSASAKSKTERVVIEFGDRFGNRHSGDPAYYNIELMEKPFKRLVIDLAQTNLGLFTESFIAQRFLQSRFVQKVHVAVEVQTASISLVLDLKKSVDAKVYNIKGNNKSSAKLVLDLLESN
jgi:hypothetical protein